MHFVVPLSVLHFVLSISFQITPSIRSYQLFFWCRYLHQAGGGIETAGGAVAINDMLLMSFEGFLRFFPVWPVADDASFTMLRAVGAFQVSARLAGGVVHGVSVVSDAGANCTFLSPWEPPETQPILAAAGTPVAIIERAGGPAGVLWRFATTAGGVYTIMPQPVD
jgi:hypothetical protein